MFIKYLIHIKIYLLKYHNLFLVALSDGSLRIVDLRDSDRT